MLLSAFLGMLLISASSARAQSGGGYDLTWSTIDSGAGTLSGGDYNLVGSIGQPDAGQVLTGGDYSLSGGFLPGKAEEPGSSVSAWSLY